MLDQTIGDFNELKTQFLIFSILYFNKGKDKIIKFCLLFKFLIYLMYVSTVF
jgi:hypothetical protein